MAKFLFSNRMLQHPTRVIALSFAAVILGGTLLLMLPVSSRSETFTPFLDCLFTATSATCVTGLVIYDTYLHWSIFGQVVILLLIQVGGLGLVTLTTFFHIAIGRKMGLRSMHLAQESVASFDGYPWEIVRVVVKISLGVEAVGALLLCISFLPRYGTGGIWVSIFLSVSAFCNAGFDILGREEAFTSLSNYGNDPIVLGTISALIIVGGIGFVVIHDLRQWKRRHQISLHTRVVLSITASLLLFGMLVTAIFEWYNPATLGALPSGLQKLGAAWFHSVSSRTAGFNTIPIDGMRAITLVLTCVLMFIGAAPGSTGGGIKCTTAAVVMMTVWGVIRGDEETTIFRRRVDRGAVYKSLAVTVLALLGVSITAGVIASTMHGQEVINGLFAIFESISAFATVGLSVGVTAIANPLARILLTLLMYIGRLGPITFFLSLALRDTPRRHEVIPEGKILIG